ncbi:MAG: hypothetical protein AVDCRST_MAG35-1014, partial [uncultured Quadrisphaera sp.]
MDGPVAHPVDAVRAAERERIAQR